MSAATDFAAAIDALRDAPLVVLAEMQFAYEAGGDLATGTVFMADGVYATEADEAPASRAYIDAIAALPAFSRAIDAQRLMGGATYSVGSLELDNSDGRLDGLLDLIVDGWPIDFYVGKRSWRRAQFLHVLAAIVERIDAPSPARIVVALRDPGYLIDKRVSGAAIGGVTSNANRRKPVAIGTPQQVEGLLGDVANLRYWIGADRDPHDIRDNGISLKTGYPSAVGNAAAITPSAAADTFTISGHGFQNEQVVTFASTGTLPAPISSTTRYWVRNRTSTTIQVSLTRTGAIVDLTESTFAGTMTIIARGYYLNGDGSVDVSATPVGRITADLVDPVSSSALTFGAAIERVALTHAGLEPARWGGAHASYDPLAFGVNPSVGYVVAEPENVVDILDRMAEAFSCWWGFSRTGALRFGALWSTIDASVLDLTADDVIPREAIAVERNPVTYGEFRLGYMRNWTRQADLADAVSPANRALWTGPGYTWPAGTPSGTAYATNKPRYHRAMTDSPEFDTVLAAKDYIDASFFMADVLDARLDLVRPYNDVVRIDTDLAKAGLELGDLVTLTGAWPLGLAARTARVIGIDVALDERRVALALLVKRTPQTASGTFDA